MPSIGGAFYWRNSVSDLTGTLFNSALLQSVKIARLQLKLWCLVVPLSVSLAAQAAIYRWVDQAGRVHFSDTRPESASILSEVITDRYSTSRGSRVELNIVPVGAVVPPADHERIGVAVQGVRDIFDTSLGVESDFNRLELHIYGDKKAFITARDRVARGLTTTTGFYDHRNKIAHVWSNRSPDAMLEVIVHEVAHAVLDSAYPSTPKWLHEGLAEYVQRISVTGQALTIPPDQQNLDKLNRLRRSGRLLPLEKFLALSDAEWLRYDGDAHIAYTQSWALTYFLMSSESGREVLSRSLGGLADASGPCCIRQANGAYPGGLAALEAGLQQWSGGQGIPAHHY